jgi:hypothetical protein
MSETGFSCTRAGWLWYCDEHDTHGNADSEDEANFMGRAHAYYHSEILLPLFDAEFPEDVENALDDVEDSCDWIVMQGGTPAEPQPLRVVDEAINLERPPTDGAWSGIIEP